MIASTPSAIEGRRAAFDDRASGHVGSVPMSGQGPDADRGTVRAGDLDRVFRAAFEHAPAGMALLSADGRFLHANRAFCVALGRPAHQLLTASLDDVIEGEVPIDWRAVRRELASQGRPLIFERWHARPGAAPFLGELHLSLLMAGVDHPAVFIAQLDDIDQQRWLEDRLRHSAMHDPMTGLPNRALFDDRLEQAASQIGRAPGYLAVLFIDLDQFKTINDRFGHAAGDHVLRQVADRLRACVRPSDTIARYGGDEFTALLEGVSGAEEAQLIVHRIEQTVGEPMVIAAGVVTVSACIGMAMRPTDAITAPALMRFADAEMYRAKTGRRHHMDRR